MAAQAFCVTVVGLPNDLSVHSVPRVKHVLQRVSCAIGNKHVMVTHLHPCHSTPFISIADAPSPKVNKNNRILTLGNKMADRITTNIAQGKKLKDDGNAEFKGGKVKEGEFTEQQVWASPTFLTSKGKVLLRTPQ